MVFDRFLSSHHACTDDAKEEIRLSKLLDSLESQKKEISETRLAGTKARLEALREILRDGTPGLSNQSLGDVQAFMSRMRDRLRQELNSRDVDADIAD